MSQANVEIVQRGIAAFNQRDVSKAFSAWSPDAEIDWSRSKGPLRGVYSGRGALERFWGEYWSLFESVELETHGFLGGGARVVVPNTAHFRGRDGIEVVARSTFVYTLEGGRISRLAMFQDRAEALEAAGLSGSPEAGSGD